LDTAIKAVSEISATTYQYAYGLGVVDNHQTRTILSQAARLGWLQIDILYIDGKPAAFQLAMKYRNTYFGEKIGFNPKWEKFSIGTVLFLRVTEALCRDPEVSYYDFIFGDAMYKSSYGDTEWMEAQVYIFAPRVFPVCVNLILSTTSAISIVAKKFVSRLGIRNLVLRYRRKRILEKS
jgi:CelD/BcsL family acetyltransferase involved in cellulose biosynthesis